MQKPAVYLVTAANGPLVEWTPYFSEVVHDQLIAGGYVIMYRSGMGHWAKPNPAADFSGFKPDPGVHPWGPRPAELAESCRGAASLTWWPLFASPTYFSEVGVSDRPLNWAPAWFTATARSARCLLTWRNSSAPSPLPGGASRIELDHGARFKYTAAEYVVWVEPSGTWRDAAGPSDPQVVHEINALGKAALHDAVKCFLALPYTSRWWGEEFMRLTGYVPSNLMMPTVAQSAISAVEGGFELRWTIEIAGREVMGFFRTLRGPDVVALRDCATILSVLRMPTALDNRYPSSMSVPELQDKLASLQAGMEQLDDASAKQEMIRRIRNVRKLLKHKLKNARDRT